MLKKIFIIDINNILIKIGDNMKQYSLKKFKELRKARKNLKVAIFVIIISILIILLALYLANGQFRKFVEINILNKEINEKGAVHLKLNVEKLSFISVFNNRLLLFTQKKEKKKNKLMLFCLIQFQILMGNIWF